MSFVVMHLSKSFHIVFLCSNEKNIRGGVTSLLSPSPYFLANPWIFYSTDDDVTVILLLGVSFMCVPYFVLTDIGTSVGSQRRLLGSVQFFNHERNAKKENKGFVVPEISTN